MFFHWRKENKGRIPTDICAYWSFGRERSKSFNLQSVFSLRKPRVGFQFSVGDGDCDNDYAIVLHVPFWSLYLSLEGVGPSRPSERAFELRYDCEYGAWGSLSWNLWMPQHEWNSTDPKWRRGSFDPADFVLGAYQYSCEKHDSQVAMIPLPEGAYAAKFTHQVQIWKRPRWPFARRREGWDIDIPHGLPFPGKGENSWDQGEDGIFGMGSSSETIEGAIADAVKATLRNRRRYGGDVNWKPSALEKSEK